MANSRIEITFNENFKNVSGGSGRSIKYELAFYIKINGVSSFSIFKWKYIRSAAFEVTIGTNTATIGERTAINFIESLNLDFPGRYSITRIANKVIINSNIQDLEFNNPYAYFIELLLDGNIENIDADISWQIFNDISPAFTIDSVILSPAVTPCSHVKVTITTNQLATIMYSPFVINPNTINPIVFEILRSGTRKNIILENASGKQNGQYLEIPSLLNPSNFQVNVNNSPNGASVFIENTNTQGLVLEYSLDNIVWKSENVFSGLAVGNYTAYVRDNFGCLISIPFMVDEFGIQSPFLYISKSNSFRFANRITWGDSENYKNDENTLSCEVDVKLAYKEIQQFQSADVITTQFKSNYSSNISTIINENLSVVNVPVIKKSNNIGIKEKRDARKYNLGNGKTGLYFISGNIYDYNTNAIVSTYSLIGLTPEWAVIGNYFQISNIWYLIEEIIFDQSKNADVIVFSNNYTGQEVNVIVGTIFNRENYDVYEFEIDMVNYIDKKFRVQLVNTNTNFPTITHISELIWCKVKHEKVLEIKYRNTTNTDIFYSTGIEHKIRIPYIKINGKSDESSEIHKTDDNAILLNADLYEVDEFLFEPVTKEIWRKIMQALSHEIVSINGVSYVKNGGFNTEGPLEQSNLYLLTASMIKSKNVYNSQSGGNLGFDGSSVEVPGLIATESGYLKY